MSGGIKLAGRGIEYKYLDIIDLVLGGRCLPYHLCKSITDANHQFAISVTFAARVAKKIRLLAGSQRRHYTNGRQSNNKVLHF